MEFRSLGVRRGSRSGSLAGGPTQPGPVGLSGVEEEMVSDAVRLLRKGVRHFFAVWARGVARREWG